MISSGIDKVPLCLLLQIKLKFIADLLFLNSSTMAQRSWQRKFMRHEGIFLTKISIDEERNTLFPDEIFSVSR